MYIYSSCLSHFCSFPSHLKSVKKWIKFILNITMIFFSGITLLCRIKLVSVLCLWAYWIMQLYLVDNLNSRSITIWAIWKYNICCRCTEISEHFSWTVFIFQWWISGNSVSELKYWDSNAYPSYSIFFIMQLFILDVVYLSW